MKKKKNKKNRKMKAFYNLTEMAEMFGMTRQTIVKWANQGRLPYLRVGRLWFFYKKSVDTKFLQCSLDDVKDGC